MPSSTPPPIEIDHLIAKCNGCGRERIFYPDKPLVGAAELKQWLDTSLTPCVCGAATCDVKAHLKNAEELEAAAAERSEK